MEKKLNDRISQKQVDSLLARKNRLMGRVVEIDEVGAVLHEATNIRGFIVGVLNHSDPNRMPEGINPKMRVLDEVITQLEASFDGNQPDEKRLMEEGKVMVPEAAYHDLNKDKVTQVMEKLIPNAPGCQIELGWIGVDRGEAHISLYLKKDSWKHSEYYPLRIRYNSPIFNGTVSKEERKILFDRLMQSALTQLEKER